MRITLVNPPNEQLLLTNVPRFAEEERGYNPPLGLLYLAAVLERGPGNEVFVIDALVEELTYEALAARLLAQRPDVVGVSTLTFTLPDVLHTVRVVREAVPGAMVVLGGPHVHLYPRETLALPGVDAVLTGEAEHSLLRLTQVADDRSRWREVPGLVWEDGGEIEHGPPPEPISELDALPFPARHLTPYERYSSVLATRSPITTMFTSRGCPYRCSFCDRPHLGKRFRARSAENVVGEMEHCLEMGIPEILVYDDTFTVKRQRVLDVCAGIQRRGLDVAWDIRARVDTVDEGMLSALCAAGCERIHYGVEAGSDELMKAIRKGITVEQARKAFYITRKAGIATLAYFMIGLPGETEADIRQTARLACELEPDYVLISILVPYPGTEIYRQALESGVFATDHWLAFARDPKAGFQPPYLEGNLSRSELEDLLMETYRAFFRRPRYIVRQLLKVRSWSELRKKARAGLRVLMASRRPAAR